MSSAETPLRSLLQELTGDFNETGIDPFEAYELLCRRLGQRGLWFDTYCSSSITSGGHARDESLEMSEIIRKNTDSAHDLCDELFMNGQLEPTESLEAVAVGKVRHWQQSDYMAFWLNVMARMPFTNANASARMDAARRDFEQQLQQSGVDMPAYNSPLLSAEQRVVEYMQHATVFSEIAKRRDADPVRRLVRLIDTDQSLGAQTENYFARIMGSRVMRVAVAHIGDATLPADFSASRLVTDTSKIVSFGGHVFDTERKVQITLVSDHSS